MTFIRYTLLLLLSIAMYVQAGGTGDELYIPRDIKRAYDRGTRALTGAPGQQYWQNSADYDIRVRIEAQSRLLSGSETVHYENNSPDTLRRLVLKLHQNMNAAGAVRLSALGKRAVTEGMHIQHLSVVGTELSMLPGSREAEVRAGNLIVTLPKPLPPGGSIELDIRWNFTIPVTTGDGGGNPRMGAYENGSMFLAYWYPKMAVYDDVHGWDMYSYDGEHEFYADYGRMTVAIDVPHKFGVWATGSLDNPAAVLREPFLSRYQQALESDSVIHIINEAEAASMSSFRAENARTVWRFSAENTPDFAFGIAKGYRWDGVSARAGDKRVFVDAAYDPLMESFQTVADEAQTTVEMLSAARPGVPFPYPVMTVFNGYYGMEFPMIVNDGQFPNRILNVYVHAHEIAHMYFPFMVGVNETRYAWMDEGMAYFLPVDVQQKLSDYNHMIRAARGYERFAGTERDYPLLIPATASAGNELQVLGYLKPALAFSVLRDMLGEERFDEALRVFIERWEGKHPLPWDFFFTFNHVTGENLNWFWKGWFFEPGYPDLGIASVETEGSISTITVRRYGSMPIPVHMNITLQGRDSKDVVRTAGIWKDGAEELQFRIDHDAPISSIRLGGDWIPDSNPVNNSWTRK